MAFLFLWASWAEECSYYLWSGHKLSDLRIELMFKMFKRFLAKAQVLGIPQLLAKLQRIAPCPRRCWIWEQHSLGNWAQTTLFLIPQVTHLGEGSADPLTALPEEYPFSSFSDKYRTSGLSLAVCAARFCISAVWVICYFFACLLTCLLETGHRQWMATMLAALLVLWLAGLFKWTLPSSPPGFSLPCFSLEGTVWLCPRGQGLG